MGKGGKPQRAPPLVGLYGVYLTLRSPATACGVSTACPPIASAAAAVSAGDFTEAESLRDGNGDDRLKPREVGAGREQPVLLIVGENALAPFALPASERP